MTKKKKIIIGVMVLVVLGLFGFFAVSQINKGKSETGIPKNAISVTVEDAKQETIVTKVNVKGDVELINKTTVYAQTDAKIRKVNIKVGDKVTKGQTLLEYDDDAISTLNNQLKEAQLSLKIAELGLASAKLPASQAEILESKTLISKAEKGIADIEASLEQHNVLMEQTKRNIDTVQKEYDDIKILFEVGALSKTELDIKEKELNLQKDKLITQEMEKQTIINSKASAEDDLIVAKEKDTLVSNKTDEEKIKNQISQQQVAVEQSQLKIEEIEKMLQDFKPAEIAEVDGTIIKLYAVDSEIAIKGKTLMEIADTSSENLIIKVKVLENNAGSIALDQDVEIGGMSLGKDKYNGKLTKIYPLAEEKQVGNSVETVITADISVLDQNTKLRPGNTVTADIITNISENVVVVPLMSTVAEEDGFDYVYIMSEDFKAEKRKVELKAFSGLNIEAQGVNLGDKIITNPSPELQDGVFVRATATEAGDAEQGE